MSDEPTNVLHLARASEEAIHQSPEGALAEAIVYAAEHDISRAIVLLVEPDPEGEEISIFQAGDHRLLCYDLQRAIAKEVGCLTWGDMDE